MIKERLKNCRWWKAAVVRAIRTFAEAAIAVIGTAAVMSEVDWRYAISAALLAAIVSILMSLAGLPEVEESADKATAVNADTAENETDEASAESAESEKGDS